MPAPGVIAAAGMPDGEGGIRPFTRAESERMLWDPLFLATPLQGATAEEVHAYDVDRGTYGVALPGFTAADLTTAEGRERYDAALAAERVKYAGTAARVDAAWQAKVSANSVVQAERGRADEAAEIADNQRRIAGFASSGGVAQYVDLENARAATTPVGRTITLATPLLDPRSINAIEDAGRMVPAGARVDVLPTSIAGMSVAYDRTDTLATNDAGRLTAVAAGSSKPGLPAGVLLLAAAAGLFLLLRD